MQAHEVRQLFLMLKNTYSGFEFDDIKRDIWLGLLEDVPYELALSNLRKYIKDPANKFPPHPGALMETVVQRSEGPYVPNAEETLRMLDERDMQHRANPAQLTDTARERMKLLGQPQPPAARAAESVPDA